MGQVRNSYMNSIDEISSVVESEFSDFKNLLNKATISTKQSLSPISNYILKPSGKFIRPLLCLLVAKLHSSTDIPAHKWQSVYAAAVMFEMIHWSTLVHDDVVDEAYRRRDQWTPSALLRSKSAVLVGDYLFSRGLAVATECQNFYAVRIATSTIETIVDGELLQMDHSHKRNTTRQIYFDIIDRKTASLIAASSQCGAQAIGASDDQVDLMRQFGILIGRAFQIQDDIIDFGSPTGAIDDKSSGKMVLNDLRESKITLPLIYVLEHCSPHQRKTAMAALRNAAVDRHSIEWLRDFVFTGGGIQHSIQMMEQMMEQARTLLSNYQPCAALDALTELTHYICRRSR